MIYCFRCRAPAKDKNASGPEGHLTQESTDLLAISLLNWPKYVLTNVHFIKKNILTWFQQFWAANYNF